MVELKSGWQVYEARSLFLKKRQYVGSGGRDVLESIIINAPSMLVGAYEDWGKVKKKLKY